jgi:hypothetical protein
MDQEPARQLSCPGEVRLSNCGGGKQDGQSDGIPSTFRDLSHDVRTSLAIVTLLCGNLDLFYEKLPDDERREMILKLRAEVARLNQLVSDVLALGNDGASAAMAIAMGRDGADPDSD